MSAHEQPQPVVMAATGHATRVRGPRPVRCWFCSEPMHYVGDPRFEPEVSVDVMHSGGGPEASFFAHARCWEARMCLESSA